MIATARDDLLRGAAPLDYADPSAAYPVGKVTRPHWLDLEIPCEDPKTGEVYHVEHVSIPKDPAANIELRMSAVADRENADYWRLVCGQQSPASFLLWLNIFGWTFRPQRITESGAETSAFREEDQNVPFITWPAQDRSAAQIIDGVLYGKDLAFDKSRKQGMSWLIVACFHWFAQFWKGMQFMEMSRVEELVDENPTTNATTGQKMSASTETLFYKHDYLNAYQPSWLKPGIERKHLHIIFKHANGHSSINGKSTGPDQGRAGRYAAVLCDEAAVIKDLRAVWVSLSQSTACRVANGTARGPTFFRQLVMEPPPGTSVVSMPWFEHPEQGRGRRTEWNPDKERFEVTSDWKEQQILRAADPLEVDQEIDRDHSAASMSVFDGISLTRHEAQHGRDPIRRGELKHIKPRLPNGAPMSHANAVKRGLFDVEQHIVWKDGGSKVPSWSLYFDADDEFGRPYQGHQYVFGIDISAGTGASNSTIAVKCVETKKIVAMFASSKFSADDFAKQVWMASQWFGGGRFKEPMIVFEANGSQGQAFWKALRKWRPRWVWNNRADPRKSRSTYDSTKAVSYGWTNNGGNKIEVHEELDAALRTDQCICPDKPTLKEAGTVIYLDQGGCGPAELQVKEHAARRAHGDRVMGACLAELGSKHVHTMRPEHVDPPKGSAAWRERRALAEERAKR